MFWCPCVSEGTQYTAKRVLMQYCRLGQVHQTQERSQVDGAGCAWLTAWTASSPDLSVLWPPELILCRVGRAEPGWRVLYSWVYYTFIYDDEHFDGFCFFVTINSVKMNNPVCAPLHTFWIYTPLEEPNSCWVNGSVDLKLPVCLPERLYQFIHLPEFYENTCYFTHMPTQHAIQLFDLDSSVRWKWHLTLVLICILFWVRLNIFL